KYHMVRFFDRKKATRRLKKVTKDVQEAADEEQRQKLMARVYVAEIDLNYTMYYPHVEPYVALFPSNGGDDTGKEPEENSATLELRQSNPMWRTVERATEHGTLEALREKKTDPAGKSTSPIKPPSLPPRNKPVKAVKEESTNARSSTRPQNRRERRQEERTRVKEEEDHDDASDGGFFEADGD
ncbi:hypothetical protein LTS18_000537, partial [Coniosporium uncinatum]